MEEEDAILGWPKIGGQKTVRSRMLTRITGFWKGEAWGSREGELVDRRCVRGILDRGGTENILRPGLMVWGRRSGASKHS